MITDPARVRILGIRDGGPEPAHLDRGCICAHWAGQWKDWLRASLPASARGRIELDVEMAHPVLTPYMLAAARSGPLAEADGLSALADAEGLGARLIDPRPGLLTLEPNGDEATRTQARDHVAVAIEQFGPDIVLGYRTGSVLAYEALGVVQRRVPLLVSVSSPLTVPQLFSALSPAPTHAQGQWPGRTEHWIDIYDRRDPFAARRPFIDHFDGPVADRPVDLGTAIGTPEQAYLSCLTLGAMLEDYFGRRRTDVNLTAELRRVLSVVCTERAAIYMLLADIGFPTHHLAWEFHSADKTWGAVMHELNCGVLERGVDQLLEQAQLRYPDNAELSRLHRHCNRPATPY